MMTVFSRWRPSGAPLSGLLLTVAGVGLGCFALGADLVGLGGAPGIGDLQMLAVALGIGLLTLGRLISTPSGRQYLEAGGTPSWRHMLLVALWFAVVAGLTELAIEESQRVFGHLFSRNPHVSWMTPVSYLGLFLVPAVFLAAAAKLGWRHLVSVPVYTLSFTFIAGLGILSLFQPQLHFMTVLLLAIGLGVVATRLATRRGSFPMLIRRSVAPLVLVAAVLGLTHPLTLALAERRAQNALPVALQDSPNILLIILDTVRAASLSLYGYTRPTTPNLDRLAESSVTFNRAISPSSWTIPSHASMFTGRHPHDLSADWYTPLDDADPTLAELVQMRGYHPAGFVANTGACGLHSGLQRGFITYRTYIVTPWEILQSSSLGSQFVWPMARRVFQVKDPIARKSAARINREFLGWLSKNRDRPFFAFLNYFDTHDPYVAPAPYDGVFGSDSTGRAIDAYDESIAYLDAKLGELFQELERLGTLDNTLLIVTADHGEEFGEHGLLWHGRSLYLPSLHVPLLVRYPGHTPPGYRVETPVALRDVANTIMDAVTQGEPSVLPGGSLTAFWRDAAVDGPASAPGRAAMPPHDTVLSAVSGRDWLASDVPVAHGNMLSLITDSLHYITGGDGKEELYNIVSDPWEQEDLSGAAPAENTLSGLRRFIRPHAERYSTRKVLRSR